MKNYVKKIHLVSKITSESAVMAFSSIKNDKFRTFLSFLGVSIGIFSIVAVFCAVNALKANINEGMSSFGSDIVYIESWPFSAEEDSEWKWWEYRTRPEVNEREYLFIKDHTVTSETVCYLSTFYALAKYGGNSFSNGYVLATTTGFDVLCSLNIEYGRFFSASEMKSGANVTVIGHEVAETLFGSGETAVGREIKVKGANTTVIGVIKKEGSSIVSIFQKDVAILVPLNFGKSLYNVSNSGGMIVAAPRAGVTQGEFQGEMRQLMRACRRLKPTKKDNFAINSMTLLVDSINQLTAMVEKIGWIIACFSLLIGGFGIANIMFVSVKERTPQIGIQKALGAPKYVILTQFLVEAVVLALAGGLIGIAIVVLICTFVHMDGFVLTITVWDTVRGLAIALVIGVLSGIIPAWSAAKLNPVDSINA